MTYQMQPPTHLRPAPSSESFCNSPNVPFNCSKDQIIVWQQSSYMVDSGFNSGASTHAPPSVCGKEDLHVNETHHESIQPHFGHAYFERHFNEEKNERHSFQSDYAHSLPESREENGKSFDDQLASTQLANVQLSVSSSQVLNNASFCFSNQISVEFASQTVSELLMLLYDNDEVVVSKAAKMLHQVMKCDFSQDIIKALPHMISTLIHTISFVNNLETVKCIAGILHSVSLHQPGLLALYKSNGIPALVNLLSSPMESILFYTVTTLHNLLLNQEGSKLSVCEAGGLQKLVMLLKHTNENFLSVVVDCLQTLAFRNPKNKLVILEYGGTEKLVHIMRTYKCQTLLWTVSRVLKALTVCCNNKPVIIKAGGMQALAMHLKNQSETFVLNCLWSLRNLSDAAINERNVESLLNQLINLLGSNDKHIVICSAGILSNLTCNNNRNKMIVCQAKGVEALIQAIIKAENNEEISEPAICTLRHLTSGHPEAAKIAVYCCSALPAIVKLLEPPSSWALIKAVIGFIRNLAVPVQNQMHLQNIGVIPKLMKLLRAAYQEIQKHNSNAMDKSQTTCIDGIKMEDIIKGTTYALQVLAKHMHNRAVMKELDIVTFLVQLGDEKPSHLLRKMKELSNGQLQDDFLQSLWLQRMPPHIQTVLSASSEPLDKLAIIADKVSEVVGASSTICAAKTVPPPSQSSSCNAQPTMDSLARQIQELSLQVAELTRERNSSRHQRYSSDRRRSHSRSRSVNRGSGICYYHRRYKEQARKCVSPCAFVQNESGQKFLIDSGSEICVIPPSPTMNKSPQSNFSLFAANNTKIPAYGIIRPSKSPWSSPLHVVPKSDSTVRPVGDYRQLNSVTEFDSYPMPYLNDFAHAKTLTKTNDFAHGKKIFSKIDIFKAFHQIPIAECDIPKTAVTTPWGKKDSKPLNWSSEAITAFQRCKQALADAALLAHPSPSAPLALHVDASDYAIGGSDNIAADVLSRVSAITFPSQIDYDCIAETQQTDQELHTLIASGTSFGTQKGGRQFESSLFKALSKLLGVQKCRTTGYHPQANGMIEELHRPLKSAIKCHATERWTEVLPIILLGLRASLKEDILCTPAELVFGTTIRLPGEMFDSSKPDDDVVNFVSKLKSHMQSLHPKPPKHHGKRPVFIHPGLLEATHVFLRRDMLRRPLQQPYDGPFKVLQRKDKVFFLDINGKRVSVSIDRCKPAFFLNTEDLQLPQTKNETPATVEPNATASTPATVESDPTASTPTQPSTRSGRKVHLPTRYR
ncbi:armadillo segment polarity protein [Trichonephila clavipes]|nr:armadillo segment polarity protein [Trichonephila clavipes]